jgi:hypothetical protein
MIIEKTLSILQPWATPIALGLKDIENRSWKTSYRGKILIHTSAKWDRSVKFPINLFNSKQFESLPEALRLQIMNKKLPISSIIGEFTLVDCIENSSSIWAAKNQWHWVLKNQKIYKTPITNVKGSLNLWNFDIEKYQEFINE